MITYVKRTILSPGFTGVILLPGGLSFPCPLNLFPRPAPSPPGRGKGEEGGELFLNWKKQVQVSCLGKIKNLARVVVHICKLRTKEVEAGGLP